MIADLRYLLEVVRVLQLVKLVQEIRLNLKAFRDVFTSQVNVERRFFALLLFFLLVVFVLLDLGLPFGMQFWKLGPFLFSSLLYHLTWVQVYRLLLLLLKVFKLQRPFTVVGHSRRGHIGGRQLFLDVVYALSELKVLNSLVKFGELVLQLFTLQDNLHATPIALLFDFVNECWLLSLLPFFL